MKTLPRMFADITARLEDAHALAVEGQNRNATPDMHRVLVCHLRASMAELDAALGDIKNRLGDAHV